MSSKVVSHKRIPRFGVNVYLREDGTSLIISNLTVGNSAYEDQISASMETIESFILAMATAGVDIESEEFLEALTTTVDACESKFL